MSRALVILRTDADRELVARWARQMPPNSRVEFKQAKRTLPQNDKMWACLTDLSQQVPWHGIKLEPEDWKLIMLDGLKKELRMVPNMDGTGFVNLGRSTSDLSKAEMADLITLILMFGDQHGVEWSDPAYAQYFEGNAA